MRRLSYILIALTLGFIPNQSHAQDAFYSVAGDVSSPQSYRYPGSQQVHLRDLLDSGGYNNAPGIARILRGTPLRTVATNSVNPKMAGSGALLFSGDVVVFRSFDGYCPGKQNALAMFDDGPVLLEIPGDGYPVWRLFEDTQLPQDGRISVTRTRHGSASEVRMSRHDFLQHGDIINLAGIAQPAGGRISQVSHTAPDFAQERGSGIQQVQYQPNTGHPTNAMPSVQGVSPRHIYENGRSMPSVRPQNLPNTSGSGIRTVWHRNDVLQPSALSLAAAKTPTLLNRFLNTFKGRKPDSAQVFPAPVWVEQPAVAAFPPPQPLIAVAGSTRLSPRNYGAGIGPVAYNADSEGAAQSTSPFSIPSVDSNPATDSLTPPEFLSRTDTGQMLLQIDNIVQTGNIAASDPFRMASQQTPLDDTASAPNARTEEYTQMASPQTPSDVSAPTTMSDQRNDVSNNAWNALFLTGLAVATGLIIFGWLKTKREQAAVHQLDDGVHDSEVAETDDRTEHTAAPVVPVPAVPEHDRQTSEQAVTVSEPTEDIVVSGDCPVLSAGIDDFETAETATFVAAAPSRVSEAGSTDDVAESLENVTIDTADTVIPNSERFKDRRLIEDPYDVASELNDATSGEQATEMKSVIKAKDNSPVKEAFSDLEDLLQNRLPLDRKQADLPLRMELFGKPAGPRHLRIDAAHTQTAPPHMMTSARQKQKSKSAATTASVSHRDAAGDQPADIAATHADHDRFDHALDFLEGQSDS